MVRKLQADCLDQSVPAVSLLRTAKTIATKLDLKDALIWIDRELNGYMELSVENLPSYRRLHGIPEAFNPYRGWMAITFENPEHARIFNQAPIGIAIGALEKDLAEPKGDLPSLTRPKRGRSSLRRSTTCRTTCT